MCAALAARTDTLYAGRVQRNKNLPVMTRLVKVTALEARKASNMTEAQECQNVKAEKTWKGASGGKAGEDCRDGKF